MKIIKRNGEEVVFNLNKIITAISKANNEVPPSDQLSHTTIESIAHKIEQQCEAENHEMNVEAIQDLVEKAIMKAGAFDIAKK
ncbi:MAG: anaerobic ribonucleoside-triphosphate reductase, partial [Treponema sp.]|nr:anaerobic ribonucleoside-triphosphate reductase [Treponema sp.]